MIDFPDKLFRVFKSMPMCWTVVAAHSAEAAERFASTLPDDQFDQYPKFIAIQITRSEDIPSTMTDITPMSDPEDPDERTCAEYFPPPAPPVDAREQHALYQQLHGSVILRVPNGPSESALFQRFGVVQTADGMCFTTIKPLPAELREFMLCYAVRPEI